MANMLSSLMYKLVLPSPKTFSFFAIHYVVIYNSSDSL